MHIYNKIHILLSTLSNMFRQLLRHLQGELYRKLKTYDKALPEDGAIMDEICSSVLIIINVFYCVYTIKVSMKMAQ